MKQADMGKDICIELQKLGWVVVALEWVDAGRILRACLTRPTPVPTWGEQAPLTGGQVGPQLLDVSYQPGFDDGPGSIAVALNALALQADGRKPEPLTFRMTYAISIPVSGTQIRHACIMEIGESDVPSERAQHQALLRLVDWAQESHEPHPLLPEYAGKSYLGEPHIALSLTFKEMLAELERRGVQTYWEVSPMFVGILDAPVHIGGPTLRELQRERKEHFQDMLVKNMTVGATATGRMPTSEDKLNYLKELVEGEPHTCIYCKQPVKQGHCGCV